MSTLPDWEYMSRNASSSSLKAASLLCWLAEDAPLLKECCGWEGLILRRLLAMGGSCPLLESSCVISCINHIPRMSNPTRPLRESI